MEVSGRSVHDATILRRLAALAPLAVVVAAAAAVIAFQPVTDPWWVYADADSTYAASGLNIISGGHSHYFDHPGLPEEEALAATFGAISLAHGGPSHTWVTAEMTHLDRARPVFRGWAIFFFVGGAALAYLLVRRLLGHWTWGVAGGLMWLAMPDVSDAIQIRPDVLLSALMLLTGFLLVRGWETRRVSLYVLAGSLAGFALMTKLHAVAILPALVLATVLAHPLPGWWRDFVDDARALASRHRLGLGIAFAVWLVLFVILNRGRFTIIVSNLHLSVLGGLVLLFAGYAAATLFVQRRMTSPVARRVFDPLYLLLAAAFAVGMAVPLSLVLSDSPRVLIGTFETLIGRNVNAGVQPFAHPASEYVHFPLLEALFVVLLAGVAAVLGVRRRDARPGLWFVASAVATLLAALRLGDIRYYAPGYILAIPAALWLFRRSGSVAAPLLVWALVAVVLVPTLMHVRDPAQAAQREERQDRAAVQLVDRVLRPNEVAVVPAYTFPVPDARWFGLVALFVPDPPAYPYRFVPDDARAIAAATAEGKHVAFYVGPLALRVTRPTTMQLATGLYEATPVPGGRRFAAEGIGMVRLRPASGA